MTFCRSRWQGHFVLCSAEGLRRTWTVLKPSAIFVLADADGNKASLITDVRGSTPL
jgi:hypothetical protein